MNKVTTMSAVCFLVLWSATVNAQTLRRLASFPGLPVNGWTNYNDSDPGMAFSMLDFNLDGIIDPSGGETIGPNWILHIQSGADPGQKWTIKVPGIALDFKNIKLMGFYEMDGDQSTREIVLANKENDRYRAPLIISSIIEYQNGDDPLLFTSTLSSEDFSLLGINDFDNNGKAEIIAANSTENNIEIWGF